MFKHLTMKVRFILGLVSRILCNQEVRERKMKLGKGRRD